MSRHLDDQLTIIRTIMDHLGIYTRQRTGKLEKSEMNDWHLSAAIYAMIQLQCTYTVIGMSLNITFAQISRHSAIGLYQSDRCIFFETAATLYRNAGAAALQPQQTKQPA